MLDCLLRCSDNYSTTLWLHFRHVISAPSKHDSYSGSAFPGLGNLLFDIQDLAGAEADARWEEVKRHLATIIFTVQSAASVLKPVTQFN